MGQSRPAPAWRRIAHLDMDAFYASVELLRRPALRGRPVAIGGHGDPNSRGVVTTATYEARAFGIRSGMALRRAAELCPDCVFLPVDFPEYRLWSRRFKAAVAEVTTRIEDRGIDEIYIDFSDLIGVRIDGGLAIARDIQRRVLATTGLSCSVGVAPNKLLAKLASELDKPKGITVLDEHDLQERIWPLPAKRINGIGPKADARLEALGIRSIGQLAAATPEFLLAHFGRSYGAWLHEAAHGRDDRPLILESEPRSMSRETTFERDLHPVRDFQGLAAILATLCRQLAQDLRRHGYSGRSVGVKARYDDFRIVTRELTIDTPVADEQALRRVAFECLRRVPPTRRLRLLGVRVGKLQGKEDTPADEPPRL
jgi:DNA polymerase-4